MSTIAERARLEAEAAEAAEREGGDEKPEPEPEPEPKPEPEPEPAPPAMTEQDAEKEFQKLEKAATTYMSKAFPIAQSLGMPVQPCPLCAYPGLAMPRGAHEVTSDIEAAVLSLIGKNVAPNYKASSAYARCEACDGWGDVLTGAQKDVSRTAMCIACGGKGYVNQVTAPPQIQASQPPAFPGAQVAFTPLPAGISDQWGRPAGHPHWGLDPALVGSPNGQQVG